MLLKKLIQFEVTELQDELIERLRVESDKLGVLKEISEYMNTNGKISNPEFIDVIVEIFDNENDFVRIKATEISEHYNEERIVDKLIEKMLNDTNYFVRGFSAKALGSLGNIKAKESLEKALLDPEGFVVSFVSESLKTISVKASFGNKLNMLKMKMKANKKDD